MFRFQNKNLESAAHLTCMSLDYGRTPDKSPLCLQLIYVTGCFWHPSVVKESKHTASDTGWLCFPFSLYHTWMRAHRTCRKNKRHHTETQTVDLMASQQLLANSLCLLSLSMGYVIVHFHRESMLARTLISEQLSFHTKEVLEINWHWSLQKLVAQ